jgi:hypothetical protein
MKTPLTAVILVAILVFPGEGWSQGRGGGHAGGGHSSGGARPSGAGSFVRPAGGVSGVGGARSAVYPSLVLGFAPAAGTRPFADTQNYGLWHQGYWPRYHRAGNWLAGVPFAWLAPPGGSLGYDNPYYGDPLGGQEYSKPLPGPGDEPPPPNKEALDLFDQAREAFLNKDYPAALKLADRAVALMPSDATMHEFRALVLFALQEYRQAASAVYAVLGSGPGWSWETMYSLYPDIDTYTQHLRALEAYQRERPKSAEGHFLLAYHYLTMGHLEHAARQLETVVQLQPNNAVAAALFKSLKQSSGDRPAPSP